MLLRPTRFNSLQSCLLSYCKKKGYHIWKHVSRSPASRTHTRMKTHNVLDKYLTMHCLVAEMNTVFIVIFLLQSGVLWDNSWCIVGFVWQVRLLYTQWVPWTCKQHSEQETMNIRISCTVIVCMCCTGCRHETIAFNHSVAHSSNYNSMNLFKVFWSKCGQLLTEHKWLYFT